MGAYRTILTSGALRFRQKMAEELNSRVVKWPHKGLTDAGGVSVTVGSVETASSATRGRAKWIHWQVAEIF